MTFGLLLVVFQRELQRLAAVGAGDATLFQRLLVEVDDLTAGALHLVDGGFLVAEVETFFLVLFLVPVLIVQLVEVVIVLFIHDEILDGVQIFHHRHL